MSSRGPTRDCETCRGTGQEDIDLGNPSLGTVTCSDCDPERAWPVRCMRCDEPNDEDRAWCTECRSRASAHEAEQDGERIRTTAEHVAILTQRR